MKRTTLLFRGLLRLFSLGVAGFVLASVVGFYSGALALSYIAPVLLSLGTAVAFRYTVIYHQFTRTGLRHVLAAVTGLLTFLTVIGTALLISEDFAVEEIRGVFDSTTGQLQTDGFLPQWWYPVLLALPSALILSGAVLQQKSRPYPRPTKLRALATSPAYFGFVSTFFGLWAVLFVGVGFQRVIVIAPVFEELLKFGVALIVSSVLFDRSMAARVGVALVVGSLFGVIEHTTTYPGESDLVYVYRTLFHAVTPAVSIGVYTMFKENDMGGMLWVAPVFPMLFHFFYNTFAVLSSIILVIIIGSRVQLVTIVYGAGSVLFCLTILLLVITRHRTISIIHRPIYEVLSDAT